MHSVHAYVGPLTVQLSGTITTGDVWTITLNGAGFGYGAQQGDSLPTIATKLADTITKGGLFHATATGTQIAITPPDGDAVHRSASITRTVNGATVSGTGTEAPATGGFTFSSTAYSKLVLNVNVSTPIQPGDTWVLSLNTGSTSASAVAYSYVAGQYGESVLLPPIDVKIADDEAPGVLVLQPTGSTNVIEPSSFVVLGDGFVRALLSTCGLNNSTAVTCFTGDFGTSEVNEINFHATLATAQDLDLGAWGLNANPDIANATTIPHLTVHGTGDGNSDFYKFTVTSQMLERRRRRDLDDVRHGQRVQLRRPDRLAQPPAALQLVRRPRRAGPGLLEPAHRGRRRQLDLVRRLPQHDADLGRAPTTSRSAAGS